MLTPLFQFRAQSGSLPSPPSLLFSPSTSFCFLFSFPLSPFITLPSSLLPLSRPTFFLFKKRKALCVWGWGQARVDAISSDSFPRLPLYTQRYKLRTMAPSKPKKQNLHSHHLLCALLLKQRFMLADESQTLTARTSLHTEGWGKLS